MLLSITLIYFLNKINTLWNSLHIFKCNIQNLPLSIPLSIRITSEIFPCIFRIHLKRREHTADGKAHLIRGNASFISEYILPYSYRTTSLKRGCRIIAINASSATKRVYTLYRKRRGLHSTMNNTPTPARGLQMYESHRRWWLHRRSRIKFDLHGRVEKN